MTELKTVKLPPALLDLYVHMKTEDFQRLIADIKKQATLPTTMPLPKPGTADEHNMWSRNDSELLAEAEDAFFYELVTEEHKRIHDMMLALGLPTDLQKAIDPLFEAFENEVLMKAKDSGRNRMSDYIKGLSKKAKEQIIKWSDDGKALTKDQLRKLDKLLSSNLPKYAQIAERFATRAGFIAKIHNKEASEALHLAGAYLDKVPESIALAEKKGVVLTARQKAKAEARGEKVEILPLTPLEANAVEHASQHAGEKLTEVSDRHIAGVKQLVIRAKKERWTAQELASKLFDTFGDHERDWRRVAITELAYAHNDAFISGCEEGDNLIGMGSENACPRCKALIIGKTVTVTHQVPKRDTYSSDMNVVWAGKSNYGRRVAEYVTAIPLHPNCRCRWHKYSRFYKVINGELVLKTTEELIQEERAKRGLKPDPELEGLSQEERLQKMSEKVLAKYGGVSE